MCLGSNISVPIRSIDAKIPPRRMLLLHDRNLSSAESEPRPRGSPRRHADAMIVPAAIAANAVIACSGAAMLSGSRAGRGHSLPPAQ